MHDPYFDVAIVAIVATLIISVLSDNYDVAILWQFVATQRVLWQRLWQLLYICVNMIFAKYLIIRHLIFLPQLPQPKQPF